VHRIHHSQHWTTISSTRHSRSPVFAANSLYLRGLTNTGAMGLHSILTHLYYVSLLFDINAWVLTPLQRASLARSNSSICRSISHLLAFLFVGIHLHGVHSVAESIRVGFVTSDAKNPVAFIFDFIYCSLFASIFAASARRVFLAFKLD